MNICIISPVFFPLSGGVQRVIYNQAKRLIKRGHKVIVITNHVSPDNRFKEILPQEIEEIEGVIIYKTYLGLYEDLQGEVFSTLVEIDKKYDINVYIGHLSPTEELYPFIKETLKKLVVHYQHGTNFLATTVKVEYADYIIVPSHNVRELVISDGYYRHNIIGHQYFYRKAWKKEKVFTVGNGFDENKFKFRGEHKVCSDVKKILFVGRLSENKGIFDLLKALEIISKKINIKLTTIGSLQVKEERIPKFEWHHHINFVDNVWKYMEEADIFVLPSYDEGFPLTILEAVGVGVPIIATPVGNIPEILDYGVGLIVPVGEINTLAETIIKLLTDEELYKECVEKCRVIRDNYTWDGNVLRLEYILNTIIKGSEEEIEKLIENSVNWG